MKKWLIFLLIPLALLWGQNDTRMEFFFPLPAYRLNQPPVPVETVDKIRATINSLGINPADWNFQWYATADRETPVFDDLKNAKRASRLDERNSNVLFAFERARYAARLFGGEARFEDCYIVQTAAERGLWLVITKKQTKVQPVVVKKYETVWKTDPQPGFFLTGFGGSHQSAGGGLYLRFPSRWLIGFSAFGRDWNGVSVGNADAYFGVTLAGSEKSAISLITGYRQETDLRSRHWDAYGGFAGLQLELGLSKKVSIFAQGGAKKMFQHNYEVLGPTHLLQDPDNPDVITAKNSVIQQESSFWQKTDGFFKVGLSIKLH